MSLNNLYQEKMRSCLYLKQFLLFAVESKVKPEQIVIRSQTFSRAMGQLFLFASSFDWFSVFSVSLVIGESD